MQQNPRRRTWAIVFVASLLAGTMAVPGIRVGAAAGEYWRYPTSNQAFLRSIPAIVADGSTLLFTQGDIGGGINTGTGVTANGVGALDTSTNTVTDYGGGNALASNNSWCGRYAGRPFISAMVGTKDDLYVSGGFDNIGGINAGGVARRRVVGGVATWTSLGGRRGLCGNHTFGHYWSVLALASAGSNVYATGTFLNANGNDSSEGSTIVNQIAMWDGTSWSALGGGLKTTTSDASPNETTWGRSLVWNAARGALYVGGNFDSVSNSIGGAEIANTSSIACWNPGTSTWSSLGAGSSTTTNRVRAMSLDADGNLIVGGNFSTMGGVAASRIAKFTPTGACTGTWSALGSPDFNTRCTSEPDITAITVDQTSNVVFATCTKDGGLHPHVAKWDGASWTWLPGIDESGGPTDEIGRSMNPVHSMALVDGRLWAGGVWRSSEGGSSGLASIAVPDTTAPVATLTTATITPSGSATVQSTETGTAYLVHSTVTVSNTASITGANGNLWNQATISSANTNTSLSAAGLLDGTYKAYAVDSTGNLSGASTGTVTVDSEAPTVAVTRAGSGTVGGGQDITVTFTLSESSSNFAAADVTVSAGTLSAFAGSGTTYTATWTPPASGSGTASISVTANKFTDTAGNNNTASTALSIVWNANLPSVNITRSGAGTVTVGQTVAVTFTLSESSSNFVAADVTVSAGTLSAFAGSGTTYTATWTPPASGSGTASISVTANKFTDTAGNNNTASTALTISYDTVPPTTTTAPPAATTTTVAVQSGASGGPVGTAPTNGSPSGATGSPAGATGGSTNGTTTTTTTEPAPTSGELMAAAQEHVSAPPGSAPKLRPNGTVVFVGDEEVDAEITRTATEIVITTRETTARLGMRNPDGSPTELDANGRLRAAPDGQVGMGVDGFAGATPVVVWIFSEPRKVGTATTDDDGGVTSQFTLGDGTAAGDHTVVLVGTDTRGNKVTVGVGLTIDADPVAAQTQGLPAVTTDGEGGGLNWWLIGVPILLAVLGALFLPAGLRRRKKEQDEETRV